ncbi:FERM, ARHGEF and pleckstrin domain-containing protein 1-like isoform X1 [Takifugu rubripes]|uniref:FERM, ARHGEF and pleckstrin domain-containing protein 1 n=1 Tax=Takifugu rubripes TaxID=31033 RepID=A0A6D2X2U3_TAKRU|nr:FERM, ARHGEF and pleckstrin domain-containing protein 1-like isoform X1 [Takifugu rubripes]|eukprot:XP_011604535.1 PREDICTED: FERM, RhoGEF and pleckstrin domain-containing protein 1-like isoform X1 [Takifugu rubripes]
MSVTMAEPAERSSTAGQRLGAPESLGVSTLEPGLRPPGQPPGRQVPMRVQLLDDTQEVFEIPPRSPGKVLFDLVCDHLNLTEGDYFGLEYTNHHKMPVWLDLLKPTLKQIRRPKNTILRFVVKFFPPDHTQFTEELTRYLFALQIKHDLACGHLICNDTSAALMVSHIIQSEIGDFDETQSWHHLLHNKYLPDQDAIRDKITECHRKHVGQTPAVSDYHLLEIARRLEMYGIRLHPAKDREGTKLSLAAAHTGVLVFQGYTKINSFNWSKIRKLSFKRKRFLIKLRAEPAQNAHHDTLEFAMASRDCCKVFWKICVEYHAFFRLFEEPKPKPKAILFTRGSSFRFSGRTQKQIFDYMKDSEPKKVPFERKHSKILSSSSVSPHSSSIRLHVPKESAISVQAADQPDLGHLGHPAEPNSAEVPAASTTNGIHDTSAAPGSDPLQPRENGSGPAPDHQFLNPESPGSEESPAESPHHVVVNGNGSGGGTGTDSDIIQSQSPEGQQLSPLTSPLLTDAGCVRNDEDEEARRKKFPTDKAYFIAKELLTTERTFIKDLQVITESFDSFVGKDEAFPDAIKTLIFSSYDPVYKFHQGFLKEVEQRLAQWEGRSNAHIKGDYQRIGDILLKNIQGLRHLTIHLQKHSECLVELERASRSSRKVEALCRDFEQQRVCYLPFNMFLLRPLHRLLHYKLILERLCKHYPPTHDDFRDCRASLADISEMVLQLQGTMMKMENFQKLLELKKDLTGIDNLTIPGREFIRLGCLSKLSAKGLQQRMFFLFSDSLVYTSRGMTPSNQFKVHGQLPLYGLTIRESEEEWGVPHSFTLYGQRQSVVVAASCASEMERWLEDIRMAIDLAEQSISPNTDLLSDGLPGNKLSEDGGVELESEDELGSSRSSLERQGHRGNTTVHVCWHRNTSVSMVDFSVAVENQLSGNLLRKFKNSNGWQKLWVVFTNFSLFFYKSHQDDYPLASLPLLGYSVTVPSESENIHKDYVFKLHFKSHVYYFRSESEYTFERWMEVIRSATCSSSRLLPSTRKDLY